MVVAFEQLHVEARHFAVGTRFGAVFLDMQFQNALTEHLYPFLGWSKLDVISYIKMPTHPGAVDLIQILFRLFRLHDEIVPDVFNRDLHPDFFAQGKRFANSVDRTLAALFESHILVHDSWNKKD